MYSLNQQLFGNTIENYIWFFSIIILGLLFVKFLSKVLTRFLFRFLEKYSKGVTFESFLSLEKKPIAVCIILVTFYFAFNQLSFPDTWDMAGQDEFGIRMVMHRTFLVALVLSITWVILRIVDFFGLIFIYKASLTEGKTDDQIVPFVKESVKVLLVIFSVFFILGAIFNLNITSLIAGLGIGGLAIALAAKESLENLLASFTIFLDKPFTVGDNVRIGNTNGTVERIGFRSTRIRTADKTYVTVPNKKMVDTEVDNLSMRTYWRVRFDLALVLDTSEEKLKEIVFQIRKYISEHPMIINETLIHFSDFGQYSYNISILYFINTIDAEQYGRTREEINLKIISIVRSNGSELAQPLVGFKGDKKS